MKWGELTDKVDEKLKWGELTDKYRKLHLDSRVNLKPPIIRYKLLLNVMSTKNDDVNIISALIY